jgi:hypothetical protein
MSVVAPSASRGILRFAGWSAYLSGGLSIVSGVFLFLFYALEVPRMAALGAAAPQTFGTLNDIATLVQFLCMLPLTVAFHRLAPSDRRGLSLISVAVGVVGLLVVVIAQALLVARVLSFEVNLPFVMAAFGLFGVWMILADRFVRASGGLPSGLARLGELAGIAFVLMSAVTLLVILINWRDPSAAGRLGAFLQQYPALIVIAIVLAVPLFLAFFVAVPLWLIWVGRRLLAIAAVAQEQSDRQPIYAGTTR